MSRAAVSVNGRAARQEAVTGVTVPLVPSGPAVALPLDAAALEAEIEELARHLRPADESALLPAHLRLGALLAARRDGLHTDRHHDTSFDRWVRDRLPFSRQHAYRLIGIWEFVTRVRQIPRGTSLREAHRLVELWRREQREAARVAALLSLPAPDLPERIRLAVGDARSLPLEPASVGLVVCSPPYNAGVNYPGYDDRLSWSEYWDGLIVPALREAARVLVHGGRLAINLANFVRAEGDRIPSPGVHPPGANGGPWAVLMDEVIWAAGRSVGLLPRERLTWLKSGDPAQFATQSTAWGTWCSAENPVLRGVVEPVFVFSKSTHSREPWPGGEHIAPDRFKALTRNAWLIRPDNPTVRYAFPVDLPAWLIELYAYPTDLVVDPFLGTGSSAVAALGTGRRFYGCDVSAAAVAAASQRVAEFAGQSMRKEVAA